MATKLRIRAASARISNSVECHAIMATQEASTVARS